MANAKPKVAKVDNSDKNSDWLEAHSMEAEAAPVEAEAEEAEAKEGEEEE